MVLYANVIWDAILGNQLYQVKDKPFFIPEYKMIEKAKQLIGEIENPDKEICAIYIDFIDQNKIDTYNVYSKKEYDDLSFRYHNSYRRICDFNPFAEVEGT